jgi:hypothetical protein
MSRMGRIQNPILAASLAVGLSAALAQPAAALTILATDTIDALTPIPSWTDIVPDASAGSTYQLTVIDPATLWSAGSNDPFSRESTANGIPANAGYGQWSEFGYTFNYGALVGENDGAFFLIGTGPTTISGLSGAVYAGFWDSYYPDNSGSQTLQIALVPEPAAWALLLAGVSALGMALRARRTAVSVA